MRPFKDCHNIQSNQGHICVFICEHSNHSTDHSPIVVWSGVLWSPGQRSGEGRFTVEGSGSRHRPGRSFCVPESTLSRSETPGETGGGMQSFSRGHHGGHRGFLTRCHLKEASPGEDRLQRVLSDTCTDCDIRVAFPQWAHRQTEGFLDLCMIGS